MIKAVSLRNKMKLNKIFSLPGYYKWWASRFLLDVILDTLNVPFPEIENALETKNGLYCIYVGIAVKESVRNRLNWHVNDMHTSSSILSALIFTYLIKLTIRAIVF